MMVALTGLVSKVQVRGSLPLYPLSFSTLYPVLFSTALFDSLCLSSEQLALQQQDDDIGTSLGGGFFQDPFSISELPGDSLGALGGTGANLGALPCKTGFASPLDPGFSPTPSAGIDALNFHPGEAVGRAGDAGTVFKPVPVILGARDPSTCS